MPQSNDGVISALGPGQIKDLLVAHCQSGGATSNDINDAAMEFLIAQGQTAGTLNDRWYGYLRGLGYTGSLSDMWNYWFCVDGGDGLTNGNDIGDPGAQGFGVGICPALPASFSIMSGTTDPASDNYGNYQYSDGSVMAWVPKFYYKIGTGSNGLAVNVIDIASTLDYATTALANAAGYALHRAFIDGGGEQLGFFVDKYQCSNNSGVASSIALGNPLSTHAGHNPISALTAAPANNYAGTMDAVKGRGSIFAVTSRFIYSALAMLSMAHGQAASATTHCAWYDAGGTTNFPKGCNDNALGDRDDATISYTTDGYSNCGKTGSGTPFAKTTHNGQACGVADLNGNMFEASLGLVRDSGNTDFYVLKSSVALADLTSGSGSSNDAWGNATHLSGLYDVLTAAHITHASAWERYGNGSNQVLAEDVSGNAWALTGLGLPKDANAQSAGGTNLFGKDGFYEKWTADLCVLSGGHWSASYAGVWLATLISARTNLAQHGGFRAACYLDMVENTRVTSAANTRVTSSGDTRVTKEPE